MKKSKLETLKTDIEEFKQRYDPNRRAQSYTALARDYITGINIASALIERCMGIIAELNDNLDNPPMYRLMEYKEIASILKDMYDYKFGNSIDVTGVNTIVGSALKGCFERIKEINAKAFVAEYHYKEMKEKMPEDSVYKGLFDLVEIACICGSTRHWDEMKIMASVLTGNGYIVLTPIECVADPDALKEKLDFQHLKKIALADVVYAYIPCGEEAGESTQREIDYAKSIGKDVIIIDEVSAETMTICEKSDEDNGGNEQ